MLGEHEPGPAAAEALHACRDEYILECVKTAELLTENRLECLARFVLLWTKNVPEERMIDAAAGMVAYSLSDLLRKFCETPECFFCRELLPWCSVDGSIKGINIGLMMLGMMETHGLLVNDWLKGIGGIREFWEDFHRGITSG